jgi:hypothetical protein
MHFAGAQSSQKSRCCTPRYLLEQNGKFQYSECSPEFSEEGWLGAQMITRFVTVLLTVLVLTSSCMFAPQQIEDPAGAISTSAFAYRVGLGYGFLDKAVQVTIDGHEVLSLIGTEEIEQHAQLLGTKMLGYGTSPRADVTVRVIVDGGQPYEQVIDLSTGAFIHIYNEGTGLSVYNTSFLVQE